MRRAIAPLLQILISVPVRVKVFGIVIVPILILGFSLNYWVTTGLSDWLSYLIDDDRVILAMEAGSRSVFLVSILAAIAAILFTYVMMFWLTQPLLELQKTADEVSQGDLHSRVNIRSNDEIGKVGVSFNNMLDNLVSSQESLRLTNRQLALMNQIARATTQGLEIHDALYQILETILETLDLETGWIYLYDHERDKFHLATWKGIPDHEKPGILACEPERLCACQHNLLKGQLEIGVEESDCPRVKQRETEYGLDHIAVSLHDSEHPLGVILLRPSQVNSLENLDIELLTHITAQINEYVSKAWLQMKLEQQETARRKLMKALIKAQEMERTRLAQELHDGAGQMLTSLLVRMKALERDLEDEKSSKKVERLCGNISDVIEHIRHISYQNRPVVLDELGLKQALESLMDDMVTRSGVKGSVDVDLGLGELPKEIEATLYRISQEVLTNAIRHANANQISLKLWSDLSSFSLLIWDDGEGFDVREHFSRNSQRHLGLRSIKDRLELLGGDLKITSALGEGTEILAVLPSLEMVTNER